MFTLVLDNMFFTIHEVQPVHICFKHINDCFLFQARDITWVSGQPDGAGGGEDCLYIYYSETEKTMMVDSDCDAPQRFICENFPCKN